ncbi:response regulator receiver domain-containing protein [Paraburkholderia sp. BL27I4N3]|nr:response regulator receiver domain-containing protein [Paraburkholderia sp. BL27I4N3]RKR46013.1 response regulator receiver domain-containing protein [Paraburkholderia sp. BL17N1]
MRTKRSPAVIGVVDDDEFVRMATSSLLRSANWKVMVYESASHLLGDTRRAALKLVVADIHMPGMDGFALLESIKLWKRPVPVIFITAYATQALLERAEASGASGFFSKPVDDARLLALIGEILQK